MTRRCRCCSQPLPADCRTLCGPCALSLPREMADGFRAAGKRERETQAEEIPAAESPLGWRNLARAMALGVATGSRKIGRA